MPHAYIRIHSIYSYTVLQTCWKPAPVYSFQREIQICNTAYTNARLTLATSSFSFIGQYPKYNSATTILSPMGHIFRLFTYGKNRVKLASFKIGKYFFLFFKKP